MKNITNQEKIWIGKFGDEFTKRNFSNLKDVASFDEIHRKNFGFGRVELYKKFLGKLDRSIRILEVGSNVGIQLAILKKMGFSFSK